MVQGAALSQVSIRLLRRTSHIYSVLSCSFILLRRKNTRVRHKVAFYYEKMRIVLDKLISTGPIIYILSI